MSEDQIQDANGEETQLPSEEERLKMLKQRARMMGITFSNNISVETLQQKIADHQAGNTVADKTDVLDPAPAMVDPSRPAPAKKQTLRQKLIDENMRLVRLRITNLDPKKKDLPGEVLTTGNNIIGTVRKYVPFGEVTENGYHVPYILYKMMKARKFLNIRVIKDKTGRGNDRVESNYVPEFALEVLPPLTERELKQLAQAQIAAGSVG